MCVAYLENICCYVNIYKYFITHTHTVHISDDYSNICSLYTQIYTFTVILVILEIQTNTRGDTNVEHLLFVLCHTLVMSGIELYLTSTIIMSIHLILQTDVFIKVSDIQYVFRGWVHKTQ